MTIVPVRGQTKIIPSINRDQPLSQPTIAAPTSVRLNSRPRHASAVGGEGDEIQFSIATNMLQPAKDVVSPVSVPEIVVIGANRGSYSLLGFRALVSGKRVRLIVGIIVAAIIVGIFTPTILSSTKNQSIGNASEQTPSPTPTATLNGSFHISIFTPTSLNPGEFLICTQTQLISPFTSSPFIVSPASATPTAATSPSTAPPPAPEPTTLAPMTLAPTTTPPDTQAPTSAPPDTPQPTIEAPTTALPDTPELTTEAPTTAPPNTPEPTTNTPTTSPSDRLPHATPISTPALSNTPASTTNAPTTDPIPTPASSAEATTTAPTTTPLPEMATPSSNSQTPTTPPSDASTPTPNTSITTPIPSTTETTYTSAPTIEMPTTTPTTASAAATQAPSIPPPDTSMPTTAAPATSPPDTSTPTPVPAATPTPTTETPATAPTDTPTPTTAPTTIPAAPTETPTTAPTDTPTPTPVPTTAPTDTLTPTAAPTTIPAASTVALTTAPTDTPTPTPVPTTVMSATAPTTLSSPTPVPATTPALTTTPGPITSSTSVSTPTTTSAAPTPAPTNNPASTTTSTPAITPVPTTVAPTASPTPAPTTSPSVVTLASIASPSQMAFDSAGYMYVGSVSIIPKVNVSSGNVSTFSGSGVNGLLNGASRVAQFKAPRGLAFDTIGNLYVSDWNNVIRKVKSNGTVTAFAGYSSGVAGYVDGSGASAMFNELYELAFNNSGNLFVADRYNHVIRMVTPAGVVSTFAGTGTAGSDNGYRTSATFYGPMGLAFDTAGNLYVSDCDNSVVQKIDTNGMVTRFAGTGSQGNKDGYRRSATLYCPMGLTFDAAGNLYVTNSGNNNIRKIDVNGTVTTYAGSWTKAFGLVDGLLLDARFFGPHYITFDRSSHLYVGDVRNDAIRRVDVLTSYP